MQQISSSRSCSLTTAHKREFLQHVYGILASLAREKAKQQQRWLELTQNKSRCRNAERDEKSRTPRERFQRDLTSCNEVSIGSPQLKRSQVDAVSRCCCFRGSFVTNWFSLTLMTWSIVSRCCLGDLLAGALGQVSVAEPCFFREIFIDKSFVCC